MSWKELRQPWLPYLADDEGEPERFVRLISVFLPLSVKGQ